ncbi:hypothetical protein [Granulicella rosea]|uniref:hypothetical protein n=1 Tax=Granulicella rosea TaxID=474952 RepID=UPI00115F577B|nr:hypothetical protein [Granulicella rosea]
MGLKCAGRPTAPLRESSPKLNCGFEVRRATHCAIAGIITEAELWVEVRRATHCAIAGIITEAELWVEVRRATHCAIAGIIAEAELWV